LFPGRTDIGVKNHYISLTGRKTKDIVPAVRPSGITLPLGEAGAEERQFSFGIPPSGEAGTTGLEGTTQKQEPEGNA
jgi:hypothetical protein